MSAFLPVFLFNGDGLSERVLSYLTAAELCNLRTVSKLFKKHAVEIATYLVNGVKKAHYNNCDLPIPKSEVEVFEQLSNITNQNPQLILMCGYSDCKFKVNKLCSAISIGKEFERPTGMSLDKLKWATGSNPSISRYAFNSCVHKGEIWICCGSNMYSEDVGSVERYNPITNQWVRLTQRLGHKDPSLISETTIVSYKGRLLAVGGYYDPNFSSDEEFDPTQIRFKDAIYEMKEASSLEASEDNGEDSTEAEDALALFKMLIQEPDSLTGRTLIHSIEHDSMLIEAFNSMKSRGRITLEHDVHMLKSEVMKKVVNRGASNVIEADDLQISLDYINDIHTVGRLDPYPELATASAAVESSDLTAKREELAAAVFLKCPDMGRLNESRSACAAIEFNNKLYVCGGTGKIAFDDELGITQTILKSVEWYDDGSKSWVLMDESMCVCRAAFTLAIINGELYAIGGDKPDVISESSEPCKCFSIEKLSKSTFKWELVTSCPSTETRIPERACASVAGDSIFVFGGGEDLYNCSSNSWNCFNVKTNKWASSLIEESKRELVLHTNEMYKVSATNSNVVAFPPVNYTYAS